jgi:hypothetical protein
VEDASGHVCVDTRVFSLPPCAALRWCPLIPLTLAPSRFSPRGRPRRLSSTSGTQKLSKWTAKWSLCAPTVIGVLRAEEAPRTNAGFPKTRTSIIPMLQDWAIIVAYSELLHISEESSENMQQLKMNNNLSRYLEKAAATRTWSFGRLAFRRSLETSAGLHVQCKMCFDRFFGAFYTVVWNPPSVFSRFAHRLSS